MRPKRRYVAFEVTSPRKLDIYATVDSLRRSLGPGQPRLNVIVFDEDNQRGLLVCPHRQVDGLKAAIADQTRPIRILGVSGTIRAAKRRFLSRPRID